MPRRATQSRGLVLGIVGVLLGLGLLIGLSVAAGRGRVKLSNLGDREFRAGPAGTLAEDVARDGPALIPEPAGGQAGDIYVQHIGDKWYAIAAGSRPCTLRWTGSSFEDPCSHVTYPPDGAGLTRYRAHVVGKLLYVDFRTKL